MALGAAVAGVGVPYENFSTVAPVSMSSTWQTIIDAGGLIVLDAATITNPTTQITAATRHVFQRKGRGTALILRAAYSSGLTSITSPTVKVFGRMGTDAWQLLKTRSGNLNAAITMTVASDAADGTLSYTTPDYDSFAWDCLGCDEVLVGVEVILAGTGTVNTAFLEGKWI